MPDAWVEASLRDIEISREEIDAAKAKFKRMGSNGRWLMMKVTQDPTGIARARLHPHTRKLQLARTLLGLFSLLFLLVVPFTLYLTTRWYWALAAVIVFYFVFHVIRSSLNLELGVCIALLEEKMDERPTAVSITREQTQPERNRCPHCKTNHDVESSKVEKPKTGGPDQDLVHSMMSDLGLERVQLRCPTCGKTYELVSGPGATHLRSQLGDPSRNADETWETRSK